MLTILLRDPDLPLNGTQHPHGLKTITVFPCGFQFYPATTPGRSLQIDNTFLGHICVTRYLGYLLLVDMLSMYKLLLAPVLLFQARYVKRTALRLSEAHGPREGTIHGELPALKLLVVGDSSAAGVGVEQQSEALALPVAETLAARTGRSVSWKLVAKSGVNTKEAKLLVSQSEITYADYLILALGTNDVTSQRTGEQFINDYADLVALLCKKTGARGVVVTGLPPLRILPAAPQPLRWYLGRYAARLDKRLKDWVHRRPTMRYISLEWAANPLEMARDRFHPGLKQYRHWAGLVSDEIIDLMNFTANSADMCCASAE